ncbi:hypothetical protein V2J09_005484 [Rumex salicifolius]
MATLHLLDSQFNLQLEMKKEGAGKDQRRGIWSQIKQQETILMVSIALYTVLLLLFSLWFVALCATQNGSYLAGIELPMPGQNHFHVISSSSSSDCGLQNDQDQSQLRFPTNKLQDQNHGKSVKFHLRHRLDGSKKLQSRDSIVESTLRDLDRIHKFRRRILEDKNQNSMSRLRHKNNNRHLLEHKKEQSDFHGKLMGSLKSGVSLGSGEYFMDVLVGTPPKQYSLIVDTGSDLNWLQCLPCHACFEQAGKVYDPKKSSSYQNITCNDSRCHHVSSPNPPTPCKAANQSCPYFYWYGDSSNTTGDFALETFTVNITTTLSGESEFKKLENVMFGCGHWNRGLFHGAAGLLGLGRGPLSFSSQIQSQYGHSFSYCLVNRYSGPNVSSKLVFGEDKDLLSHPGLNFTSLTVGKENPVDTFYYLEVKSVHVGGEALDIPEDTWRLSNDGGGTIVDSGTTLSYFVEPAYKVIKEAFEKTVKGYPLVKDFPVLAPCYNVSGLELIEKLDLPEFGIRFKDGSQWNFPVQNYFIWIDQHVICLAFLSVPTESFSIIGNYQQQNFHVMYDTKKSRLGFVPARLCICAREQEKYSIA